MSQPTADPLPQAWLAAALKRLPDGVAVFDGDWTIRYANPAAARLLDTRTAELAGRNLWIALPEVAGSVFHSFLLHARTVGAPVTWRGFYAPAGRWLSATAELVDDLLQVSFREAADLPAEGPVDAADEPVGEDADHDRLRFLAEVSEALITTLDRGESAGQLAAGGAAAGRLGDRRAARRGRGTRRGGLGAPGSGSPRGPGHLHDRAAARHRR